MRFRELYHAPQGGEEEVETERNHINSRHNVRWIQIWKRTPDAPDHQPVVKPILNYALLDAPVTRTPAALPSFTNRDRYRALVGGIIKLKPARLKGLFHAHR